MTTNSSKNGPAFLQTATRNYISGRLLFLNGQHYDGGVIAHEAIEKVLKSVLYLLDDSRIIRGHKLEPLKEQVESELGIDLSEFDELFVYYELCYAYRYPDDQQPESFGTGTQYIHYLDKSFLKLHDIALSKFVNEDKRNKSGIYTYCDDYFQDIESDKLNILINANDEIEIKQIDAVKEYWHSKGIYIKDANGTTRFPGGITTRTLI